MAATHISASNLHRRRHGCSGAVLIGVGGMTANAGDLVNLHVRHISQAGGAWGFAE